MFQDRIDLKWATIEFSHFAKNRLSCSICELAKCVKLVFWTDLQYVFLLSPKWSKITPQQFCIFKVLFTRSGLKFISRAFFALFCGGTLGIF